MTDLRIPLSDELVDAMGGLSITDLYDLHGAAAGAVHLFDRADPGALVRECRRRRRCTSRAGTSTATSMLRVDGSGRPTRRRPAANPDCSGNLLSSDRFSE